MAKRKFGSFNKFIIKKLVEDDDFYKEVLIELIELVKSEDFIVAKSLMNKLIAVKEIKDKS
jgi:hypothetical protein